MKNGDLKGARKSLNEEREAIAAYGRRGKKAKSKSLKATYRHARGEEREHAQMFRRHVMERV